MHITDENRAIAARKNTLAFHKRAGVKSINEIAPHSMTWAELNSMAKDATKACRSLLDRVDSGDDLNDVEAAVDGLTDLVTALDVEKDTRNAEGSKEPRKQSATAAMMAKRPSYGEASVGYGDDTAPAEIALRSNQPMRAWAEARSSRPEHLRGMNAGQFLRAMIVNDKSEVERRALAEATDSAGGYTVPDVLSAELIDAARAASVVMQAGARTIPLTSDRNTIARVLTDPSPAWRAEAGAVANSDPTFGPVVLTPQSLAVSVDISAELMADSLNLATSLPGILAAAMAVELDRVALIGSGSAPEPRGIANTVGIGTFAQDALIANYLNLSKARTGIMTANRGPVSAYVMHPRDEGSFTDLADANGQPLMAPRAVAEIPMLTTTSLPINGGTGTDESTIIAGNFEHLLIGIRSNVQVELLKTTKYATNLQYQLVCHMRADIAVEDPGAFYTLTGVGNVA